MKRYLMLVVLIGVFVGFGTAFANPYFPENVGSTWSYQSGSDTIGAQMTPQGLMFGEDLNTFITDGGAVYWTGLTTPSDGSGRSYDPPYLLALPASTSSGTYQNTSINVNRWLSGVTLPDQTWDVKVSIGGLDDVIVPYGTFDGCIRIEERITRHLDDGTTEERDTNLWYAKDVGLVQLQDVTRGGSYNLTDYNIASSSPTPEPATLLLLGSGLVGLAGFGRKKFKK